jgi:sporulation protein YlmC with PRC-barrel domain
MLVAARHTYGAILEGPHGRLGTLYDILFDDQSLKVRHLVVSIDRWFYGRQVLVDPQVVERANWPERKMAARLTSGEIHQMPRAETDLPVARRHDMDAARILVWEAYWTGDVDTSVHSDGDPHLRSTKTLTGLHIHCTDGMLGHVDDFVIDDQTWTVCRLVVETRNWWPGKRVLVEPSAIESIHWEDGEVYLTLPRDTIFSRPAYDGSDAIEESLVETR